MFDRETIIAAKDVLDVCREAGLKIATAESCTGGLIAAALTSVPGSSDVVDRGFVTYSNEAKSQLLKVPAQDIEQFGAVSEAVARSMATGALERSLADIAVSVTGVAGPGGGSEEKPVGLVHFAVASASGGVLHAEMRYGDLGRDEIRAESVRTALGLLYTQLSGSSALA